MIYEIDFSQLFKGSISDLNREASRVNPYLYPSKFELLVDKLIHSYFMERTMPIAHSWTASNNFNAAIIKNTPIDSNLSETPISIHTVGRSKSTYLSELILSCLARCFGDTFAFQEEHSGMLIKNIFPRLDRSKFDSNYYGAHELRPHTEVAWSKFRPDFIALLCLKNDSNTEVPTELITAKTIVESLSDSDFNNLQKQEFRIGIPEAFRNNIHETYHWTKPTPLIFGDKVDAELRVNLSFIRSFKNVYSKTLVKLDKICHQPTYKIHLKKGDFLIINNRNTLHGRKKFIPSFNGSDRWIQQIYIKKSITPYKKKLLSSNPNIFSLLSLN